MSFAAVGSAVDISGPSPSLNPTSVGNLILIEVIAEDPSVYCTGVTGGGCVWQQLTQPFIGSTTAYTVVTFVGRATTTGSAAVTFTWNGATPSVIRNIAQEFSSTVGTWVLDASANLDANAAGWSSMTPQVAGELYFAYAWEGGSATSGSTSGYVYGNDSHSNGFMYDAACTGAAQAPTFGNSDQRLGQAILLRETPVYVVQSATANSNGTATYGGSFTNPVSAGNTVILVGSGYNSAGTTITSSNPTLGGSAYTGAIKLFEEQKTGAGINLDGAAWLLPNVQTAGLSSFGLTFTNNTYSGSANGIIAYEVAGLGTNPSLDVSIGTNSTSGGTQTSFSSGTTAATRFTGEFVLEFCAQDQGTTSAGQPGAPWNITSLDSNQNFSAGWRIGGSSGQTFSTSFTVNPASSYALGIISLSSSNIRYNTGAAVAVTGATQIQFTVPNTGGTIGTGVQAGDVMLVDFSCFTEDSSQPTIGFSGGGGSWQLVPMTDGSTNPQLSQSGSIYCYNFAYYRIATAGDIGATITITETGSPIGTTWLGVAMAAYTGANQLNPIDRAGGAHDPNTSASITCPTETARISTDWAVYLCGGGFDNGATMTGPTNTTRRQFTINSGGTGALIHDNNGSTGLNSIGGGTFTSNMGNAFLTAFTVALAPAGVYVVQTCNSGTWNSSLSSNATPSNTLLMFPVAYNVPSNTTSSNPTYNNASVTGATQLWTTQSTSGNNDMYSAAWMLPNLPMAATGFDVTVSGGAQPSPLCANLVLEILGLGITPTLDQVATAHGSSGNTSLGPTGATRSATELIVACGAIYGDYPSNGPSLPWTDLTDPSNQHGIVSWQISSTSGSTYSWAENGNGSPWAGGIATIALGTITTSSSHSQLLMIGIA